MKKMIILAFALTLMMTMNGCGNKGDGVKSLSEQVRSPLNQDPIQQDQQDQKSEILGCLEEKAGFLRIPPTAIPEFVEVMGQSGLACKADRVHIKEYALKVIQEHGDLVF